MTFDYKGLRDGTALPMLREYGAACTLEIAMPAVYDPDQGRNVFVPPQTHDCVAVIQSYEVNEIDGDSILTRDRKIMFLPLHPDEVEPQAGHTLIEKRNGTRWNLIRVDPEAPAGDAVYYIGQGRR